MALYDTSAKWFQAHGFAYVPPSWVGESFYDCIDEATCLKFDEKTTRDWYSFFTLSDESWQNDPGGAHFVLGLLVEPETGNNYYPVELWIDSINPSDREMGSGSRYHVYSYVDGRTLDNPSGGETRLANCSIVEADVYIGDDEDEARQAVRKAVLAYAAWLAAEATCTENEQALLNYRY